MILEEKAYPSAQLGTCNNTVFPNSIPVSQLWSRCQMLGLVLCTGDTQLAQKQTQLSKSSQSNKRDKTITVLTAIIDKTTNISSRAICKCSKATTVTPWLPSGVGWVGLCQQTEAEHQQRQQRTGIFQILHLVFQTASCNITSTRITW